MKLKKYLGIDIGEYSMKCCLMHNGSIEDYFLAPLPENMVKDGMIVFWEACADFIRQQLKEHNMRCRDLFMTVPTNGCFFRIMSMPVMTVQQLMLNLPYEFRDYINEQAEDYYFDYAVLSRDEKEMHLMAAAMRRDLIEKYRAMAKQAGLRLRVLLPNALCYQRLLQYQLDAEGLKKDYALLNIDDDELQINFLPHGIYETTRSLTPGLVGLTQKAAEHTELSPTIIRQRLYEGILDEYKHPALQEDYEALAVQIMRVLNFYSFNNPQNAIDTLYYFGDGAQLTPLLKALKEQLELPVAPLTDLFPNMREDLKEAALNTPETWGLTIFDEKNGSRTLKQEKEKGLPSKILLNLCYPKTNGQHAVKSLAVFAVYLLVLAAFTQIFVCGALRKADRAEAKYAAAEESLASIREANEVYPEVRAAYSHYGNGYLNEEEKALPDRLDALDTIDRCVSSYGSIQSLQISGTEASVSLQMPDGSRLSEILAALEADPMVNYTRASMSQTQSEQSYVSAQISIYFKDAAETAAQSAPETEADAEAGENGSEG